MAIFTPSGSGSAGSGGGAASVSLPTIQNITLATAGTEYSVTIPVNSLRFQLKSRQDSILKISYTSGQSAINYWTVGYGVCYTEDNLDGSGITLYFQSSKDGTVVEVLSWE